MANSSSAATRFSISSSIRTFPGSPVSGDWARISLARRSTPRIRARSSGVSNGLTM